MHKSPIFISGIGPSGTSAVIRHDDLVSDPRQVFDAGHEKLGIESDSAPVEIIDSTLFNSSFNPMFDYDDVGEVTIKKRLSAMFIRFSMMIPTLFNARYRCILWRPLPE